MAEDSSAKQEARELFREANRLVQAGEHQRAVERFRAAYALYPSSKILVNMASTLSALGQETEAATTYERCLRDENADLTPDMRALVETALLELRLSLGQVTVEINEIGATILIDGLEVGRSPLAQPIWVRTGIHRVEAQKDGFELASETSLVAGGELRAFRLQLLAQHLVVVPPVVPAPILTLPPAAPLEAQRSIVVKPETVPTWKRWPFWVAVGAGIAATTVMGALLMGGGSEHDVLPPAEDVIDKR